MALGEYEHINICQGFMTDIKRGQVYCVDIGLYKQNLQILSETNVPPVDAMIRNPFMLIIW
jgi:hypothetical protein